MSVTFWVNGAPTEKVEFDPTEWPGEYETVPVAPYLEINMTAGNANAILQLISPLDVNQWEDPVGTWDHAALARVRSATILALNTQAIERATSPTTDVGGPGTGTCRVISFGRDANYVTQRLEQFLALTKVAMDHNMTVSFG